MTKLRVYEVARDLGLDNKALVALLQSVGVSDVRNHMSAVAPEAIERVKRQLEKQQAHKVVEERIRPTVVKRRAVQRPGAAEAQSSPVHAKPSPVAPGAREPAAARSAPQAAARSAPRAAPPPERPPSVIDLPRPAPPQAPPASAPRWPRRPRLQHRPNPSPPPRPSPQHHPHPCQNLLPPLARPRRARSKPHPCATRRPQQLRSRPLPVQPLRCKPPSHRADLRAPPRLASMSGKAVPACRCPRPRAEHRRRAACSTMRRPVAASQAAARAAP